MEVLGRKITLPRVFGGHLRAGFNSLCGANLGSQDYLVIAARFHTLFLEDVPILSLDKRNEAARFVILIDALYEAKAKLVVLAAAEPDILYRQGDGRVRVRAHRLPPSGNAFRRLDGGGVNLIGLVIWPIFRLDAVKVQGRGDQRGAQIGTKRRFKLSQP